MTVVERRNSMNKILSAIFLLGCSVQLFAMPSNQVDWQDYGYQQGLKGQMKVSLVEMSEMEKARTLTPELYAKYSAGYEEGRLAYCQQDAFDLGTMQRPYHGVCDQINPSFRTAYRDGQDWDDGPDWMMSSE
jgi:hypothetical protein